MQYRSALHSLAEVTGSQWGLVTAAQAVERGVSRLRLSRLAESGDLERLAHGVYKDAGAPSASHLELRATWLSTTPAELAEDRLKAQPASVTVSGESAATLHSIGNLRAMRHEFTVPRRRQTQRLDMHYRIATLPREDVTIRDGLPVTTVERTIADLVEARTDLTLVANALADAARIGGIDVDRLVDLLAPLAARNGFARGDGAGLLKRLLELGGMDREATAKRIAILESIGPLVAANVRNDALAIADRATTGPAAAPPSSASNPTLIAEQLQAAAWAEAATVAADLAIRERDRGESLP